MDDDDLELRVGGHDGTATGLTNGTSYVFRVAAVNAAGTGAWSADSAPVIPDVLPAAPTIGTPTAGAAQVTVSVDRADGQRRDRRDRLPDPAQHQQRHDLGDGGRQTPAPRR